MRKCTQEVFRAWQKQRENESQQSIWTDGKSIYSYSTCIVAIDDWSRDVIVNMTNYSKTTTCHQRSILSLLRERSRHIVRVGDLDRGASAEHLMRARRSKYHRQAA